MMVAGNFYKSSYNRFLLDCKEFGFFDDAAVKDIWNGIARPRRVEENGAKYTFYLPYSRCIQQEEIIKILTGVGLDILPGWVLILRPRKGIVFVEDNEDKYFINITENNKHLIVTVKGEENLSLAEGDPYIYGTFLQYGVSLSEKEF